MLSALYAAWAAGDADAFAALYRERGGILLAGEDHLPVDRERRATWVLQRTDDRWLIAAYSNAPAH